MNLLSEKPNPRSLDIFSPEFAKTQQIFHTDMPKIEINSLKKDGDTGYIVSYTYQQLNTNGNVSGLRIKANDLVAHIVKNGKPADQAYDILQMMPNSIVADYLIENHK